MQKTILKQKRLKYAWAVIALFFVASLFLLGIGLEILQWIIMVGVIGVAITIYMRIPLITMELSKQGLEYERGSDSAHFSWNEIYKICYGVAGKRHTPGYIFFTTPEFKSARMDISNTVIIEGDNEQKNVSVQDIFDAFKKYTDKEVTKEDYHMVNRKFDNSRATMVILSVVFLGIFAYIMFIDFSVNGLSGMRWWQDVFIICVIIYLNYKMFKTN